MVRPHRRLAAAALANQAEGATSPHFQIYPVQRSSGANLAAEDTRMDREVQCKVSDPQQDVILTGLCFSDDGAWLRHHRAVAA
ncbi:hypothetical protein ACVMB0_000065 [Bradyrhizobium sp. USDA 4451]